MCCTWGLLLRMLPWGRCSTLLLLRLVHPLGLCSSQPLAFDPPLCSQSLLDKLDTLLVVQAATPGAAPAAALQSQPTTPPAAAAAAPDAQPAAAPPAAADGEEQVEVSLQEGADGQVAFKLTLSPSKAAPVAAPEAAEEQHSADPGHMPVSPSSATAAAASARPPLPPRIELRPGALHDGAARGEALSVQLH